jgi:PIN domain nuclease of toxin-antitoxin system
MPERYCLDASAVLAYLQQGMGWERVREALRDGAVISAVNLAEVLGKLKGKGKEPGRILTRLLALGLQVLPFTVETARIAGELDSATRTLGLSLGDRACLSTAMAHGMVALTADRTWEQVSGVSVEVIRGS